MLYSQAFQLLWKSWLSIDKDMRDSCRDEKKKAYTAFQGVYGVLAEDMAKELERQAKALEKYNNNGAYFKKRFPDLYIWIERGLYKKVGH